MIKINLCGVVMLGMLYLTGCGTERMAPEQSFLVENKEDTEMAQYYFPSEEEAHEGTWLIWPHHYTYGKAYREEIEDVWLEMTYALHKGENVHIIAYDEVEQNRITQLLELEGINESSIDFVIAKSDDVWARDTGPMFAFDEKEKMVILDFAFDGWGGKTPYKNDDAIPKVVAGERGIPSVEIPQFVLEGGSVELDGHGTALLCKSSVVSKNRNPAMSVSEVEKYLSQYLGVDHFIWLEGVLDEDITDAHIDGMARFYGDNTLLTVSEDDFIELYEAILPEDYETLLAAKNAEGKPYKIITLPLTAENVEGLDYRGSYLNYYVGNEVVLVPVYGDANDKSAIQIISGLYHDQEVVPIDVTALYQYGGMLHCITQQQPDHT